MRIDALPLPAPPQTTGTTANVHAARWRQTLEAALWQARPGVPPAAGEGPPEPGSSGSPCTASSDLPPCPGASWPPDDPRPIAAGDNPGPTAARPDRVVDAGLPEPARTVLGTPAPPIVGAMPAGPATLSPTPRVAAADPRLATSVRPSIALEPPPTWPSVAGQAWISGDQVHAAWRDARLDDAAAASLRRALERRLAGSGLRLAELRVNGQPVIDPQPRS